MRIRKNRAHKILLKGLFALSLTVACAENAQAQDFYLPVDNLSILRMERGGIPVQKGVHFGYKPVLQQFSDVSKIEGIGPDNAQYFYKLTEKIFSEHLIELRKPGLKLNADLLFDFAYGRESIASQEENSLFANTRGFAVSAQIGDHVFIHTDFRENQGRFSDYINRFVDSLEVMPGTGRVKEFKGDAYDFSMANGSVGVKAADWLSFSFGHRKQFVGHGYRSILLSDNAFNYPYASYILSFGGGKFQYRYTIGLMQNLVRLPAGDTPESIFKRKYSNQNYLSYKPLKNLEIGLFESIIWKNYDDTTGTEPFNANALNPVPLVNSAIFGLNDADANALVGLNLAWQPLDMLRLYGQIMLDDLDTERYGYQAGVKFLNLLNCVDITAEFNSVEPGSYASANALQGYTNHNQPLAHPLGAGFEEMVGQVTYYKNRILISAGYRHAQFADYQRDPLISDLASPTYFKSDVSFQDFTAAYVFNPRTNFQVYARFTNRIENGDNYSFHDQFWYLGLRTNLQNVYTDF